MNFALKIIEALIPLVIEIIKNNYPDVSHDDHKQIAQKMINDHLEKLPKTK